MSKSEKLFTRIGRVLDETNGTISRTELETQLNYNSDYLNRIVKQNTGRTLGEYKKLFVLKEAERLLIHSTKTISEICDYLGYTNHTYFNKMFFEKNRMTPTEFRNSSKN